MIKPVSAGVVVVKESDEGYLFLMLRAYSYWDMPKGRIDSDEKPMSAAIRETKEETTIDDLDFKWGLVNTTTEPYGAKKKTVRYYIAETSVEKIKLPVSPELGRPEHNEARWVTYQEGMKLASERIQKVLTWANDIITEV